MSFWDNVKKFAQPYSEDDYDDYEDEMDEYEDEVAAEPAPRSSRRVSPFAGAVTDTAEAYEAPAPVIPTTPSFTGHVMNSMAGKQEVVLFHAKTFDDAAKAADELRNKKAVILNINLIQNGESQTSAALRSGFSDYSCFYRLYKKYYKNI